MAKKTAPAKKPAAAPEPKSKPKPKPKPKTKKLAIAYESDGVGIGSFEKLSAKKKGLAIEDWRKESLAAMKSAGKGTDLVKAAKFLEDRSWTDVAKNPVEDDSALKDLLDHTRYSSDNSPYAGTKTELDGMPTHRKLWQYLYNRKLAFEGDWQYRTSVSFVTKDDQGKVTSRQYADTAVLPNLARHGGDSNAPLGSFMKVTTDKFPDNPLRYARILDSGSLAKVEAEVGLKMAQNLGEASPDPAKGPQGDAATTASVQAVAKNPVAGQMEMPLDGMLSNEETQYAGWLAENKGATYDQVSTRTELDKTMKKHESDPDFTDYKKKVKDALKAQAEQIAAGDRVEKGVPTQVFVGEKHRQLATKGAKTKAGDVLKEGVDGLYAGPGGKPVSVVGSQTVQGKAVKNGVGHIDVGGPATTRDARPRR